MTLRKVPLVGLRVSFGDGRIVDILPDDVDNQSTAEGNVLSVEKAHEGLRELFAGLAAVSPGETP